MAIQTVLLRCGISTATWEDKKDSYLEVSLVGLLRGHMNLPKVIELFNELNEMGYKVNEGISVMEGYYGMCDDLILTLKK